MPIYRYACDACGEQFQTLVRGGETPACPECGGERLTQQLSLIAEPAKGGAGDAAGCCCAADGGGDCGAAGCGCGGPGPMCGFN